MTRFIAIAVVVAGVALSSSPVYSATVQDELQSREFLIGTWNCSYTVGPQTGAYTTTWSNVLDGHWLQQTYDQPTQPRAPGFKAQYFVGYDEKRQAWVRFGAMTTGQYFAIRMNDAGEGNWTWKYVTFFNRTKPETPDPDATFTKKSDTEYTVDGPTYPMSGRTVTEHHVCRKSTDAVKRA
jgi:hypothetical protein